MIFVHILRGQLLMIEKKKRVKQIDRYSNHKCDNCGNEWMEHLMIFKDKEFGDMKILHKK